MTETGNTREKRLDERFALYLKGSAEVLYRRSMDAVHKDPQPKALKIFKVETVNISESGMMLTFDPELSTGDIIRIYFTDPEAHTELIFEGEIRWMRRNAANLMGRYFAGIAFRNDPGKTARILLEYSRKTPPSP